MIQHRKLLAGSLLALICFGSAFYGVAKVNATVTEYKAQIVAEAIDKNVLRKKLSIRQGQTEVEKYGKECTPDELRQALFLCTRNQEEYRIRLGMIKDQLGDL